MAKMFYTMDETKAALGKTEDEIKQLAREGKLREFRDGPRLMFKADQVEGLKGDGGGAGGTDQITLGAGDTHAPLGLMDSKTGSGTGTAVAMKTGNEGPKEDTASGMDVGLSGSLSGSIGGGSLAGSMGGGSLAGGSMGPGSSKIPGKQGVNVLGGDDNEPVDPMAQTHITPPKDQISLEGVGSGSGLLDLTRETDDTSLGAALLDEISPGGKRLSPTPGAAPVGSSGSTAGMTSISPMELPSETVTSIPMPMAGTPVYVEAPDPSAPAFAAVSIGGALCILAAIAVLINAIQSDNPLVDGRFTWVKGLADKSPFMILGIFFVVAIIFFVGGIVASKMNRGATA